MKEIEQLRDLAYRAHSFTSFTPEKRADQFVNEYSKQLAEDIQFITEKNGDVERYKGGYLKKLQAWLSAKSRCISSMITGPSNFPVRKAEKANNSEHNRYTEFSEWREKVLKVVERSYKKSLQPKEELNPNNRENNTIEFNDFNVIYNYEINRVQIQHHQKPDQDVINTIKKHAFRWSPRNSCWQRQLTNNGILAVQGAMDIKLELLKSKP